jgi:HTH-type transcriptional regulator/antitoxin HigA
MELKPIRTESEYKAALQMIEPYFDYEPVPGSEESDRFEVLAMLIEAYETKHIPISLPDPIEAIKFRMDQAGLTTKDLVPAIGQLNRVYEVLARKRPLSLRMIQNLHEQFGIPAESLIRGCN